MLHRLRHRESHRGRLVAGIQSATGQEHATDVGVADGPFSMGWSRGQSPHEKPASERRPVRLFLREFDDFGSCLFGVLNRTRPRVAGRHG